MSGSSRPFGTGLRRHQGRDVVFEPSAKPQLCLPGLDIDVVNDETEQLLPTPEAHPVQPDEGSFGETGNALLGSVGLGRSVRRASKASRSSSS